MREIKDVRLIQMDVLTAVHNYCMKQGIEYSLIGGSLIGSVRHAGFIPWDDDIDITMMREDYERFIKEFEDDRFKIATHRNTENYFYPYAKVYDNETLLDEKMRVKYRIGVGIDVFPVDQMAEDSSVDDKNWKRVEFYRKLIGGKLFWLSDVNPVKRMGIRLLSSLFSGRWLAERIDKIAQSNRGKSTHIIANIVWGYGKKKEELNAGTYNEFELCKFEDRTYYRAKNYDYVLSHVFGDYMKLPPKDQRVAKHHFDAFYKK